jgi:putative membrane protein
MKKNRWLLSGLCGIGLLAGSATSAIAQNVPGENATTATGPGAAPQTVTLKPGQETGTDTVLPADTAANPNASNSDARFVRQASAGGMAEIMMGHLAMQRGQTQAERDFGQMLVTDHTQANDQLSGIAQTLMLQPAPGPNAMDQAMYQQLEAAPADQFDTMFNQDMIDAHQRTIALFETESRAGQSPQLRQFATETLPVLYKHLNFAQGLSPTQAPAATSMNGMATMPQGQPDLNAPVRGNPDHSADQLNARELNSTNPS